MRPPLLRTAHAQLNAGWGQDHYTKMQIKKSQSPYYVFCRLPKSKPAEKEASTVTHHPGDDHNYTETWQKGENFTQKK